jgi:hypothetical protein
MERAQHIPNGGPMDHLINRDLMQSVGHTLYKNYDTPQAEWYLENLNFRKVHLGNTHV